MSEDYSDGEEVSVLTSNDKQVQCAGAWLHLLVVSCSLPLRAHPSEGCSAHALCVSLLDELKEEVHVVVRHRVKLWRRVAKPGSWCAVAGLLPAPFQQNARVWRTGVHSRVRSAIARRLREHLYPRAWQEQHSRTRAGIFLVLRRLHSGDIALRSLTDGAEFLLVTYFASRVASFPPIQVGALVSLHGASCLDNQGVLAMCARTDLRVVSAADASQVAQTFAHVEERTERWQTFRSQEIAPRDGRDEACDINLPCADRNVELSFASRQLQTGTKFIGCDRQESLEHTSFLDAVPNLFISPQAKDVFSLNPRTMESIKLDGTEANSQSQEQDSVSTERTSNARRFFDDSPRLYKPPKKLQRKRVENVAVGKMPACGNVDTPRGFPTLDLEDEDLGSEGTCALDIGARNLAQYLWYLEVVIKFRGCFGEVADSDCLELAAAKLLCLLSPVEEDQGSLEAHDKCPSVSCHCLPDDVLADCFSDDHVCPLVACGDATFPLQLCLNATFEETLQGLLSRREGLHHCESAAISDRLQNVVGIVELSPNGSWHFRQPRFEASILRKRVVHSVRTESTYELYDSGFQSPEDSPSDSDFQSRQNFQTIVDTDSQSQRLPTSFVDSLFPSQLSSCSFESAFSRIRSSSSECSNDKAEQNSEPFVAVVMNAELDASMHGRLVLLSECRLVAESGTIHEMAAGLWVDSPKVQDLAHFQLPAPMSAAPPSVSSTGSCPLCANGTADVEHCDERWDPDIDAPSSATWLWEAVSPDGVDPTFVASSRAKRHRFVLQAIGAPALDVDKQRSCLLLISLLQSFAQPTPGRTALLSLHGAQLRWLPLLRLHASYTLRGCAKRVPEIVGLPVFRTQSQYATLERHVCPHDWPAVTLEGTRSLDAVIVGVNALHTVDGIGSTDFGESACLVVQDLADGTVRRLYMSGWGQREPPRTMIRGTRLRVTCVRERTSAAGRSYLHLTPLTAIQVVALVSAEPAWWEAILPPIGLPGVTAGLLAPRCIKWALAAARCPRCSASKREYVCDRCGLAGPGRTRVTLRLQAAQGVELVAVDDVAASVLGYTTVSWQRLIDQVAQVGGALEWAGPDDDVPEDRHSAPWIRHFYAACRSQPLTQLAVRCRAFKGSQDSADLRYVLEARSQS